jgi:hypothetical protein
MSSPIGRHPLSTKGRINTTSVVIPNGTSTSGIIDLRTVPRELAGIIMPAAWTNAALTFEVSVDGTNFFVLHNGTAEFTILAAGGAAAGLAITLFTYQSQFSDWPFVRIRSGVIGAYVNQGAARTLQVVTRDV